jgi:hypothetical protein
MGTGIMVDLGGAHARTLVAVRGHGIMMMVMMATIAIVIMVMVVVTAVVIMIVIVGPPRVLGWIVIAVLVIPMKIVTILQRIEGEESPIAAVQWQALAFGQLPHLLLLPFLQLAAHIGSVAIPCVALRQFLSLALFEFPHLLGKVGASVGAGIRQAKR